MATIGKSIDLYLMDGTTSGRWQAKLANWNCDAYKIPRSELRNCEDIKDISGPGVYFLFGRDDDYNRQFVYVGEGDNCRKRISQPHGFENDSCYWTEAVIYVTPDGFLNKAMIKYLENRFYTIVKDANRYIVKNGNTPTQSSLQRKTKDALEEFINNASLVMQALGHKVFEPLPSDNDNATKADLLYFVRNQGKGGKAVGKIDSEGFWVLKGSYINPEIASYLPSGVKKLRSNYSKDIDKKGILKRDICFGSPSYASAFVCGKNSNGLTEWKNADGISLKELNGDSTAVEKPVKSEEAIVESYTIIGKQKATMVIDDNKFIVKAGSQLSLNEVNSCKNDIRNYRKKLIEDGSVESGVFTRDVVFNSPSMAAGCIKGMAVNGRTAWKNKDGKTLKEVQEEAKTVLVK